MKAIIAELERVKAAGVGEVGGDHLEKALAMLRDVENDPNLALWFTPQAIKDHFNNCDSIEGLTEEQLLGIAESAMMADELYETFHTVLVDACAEELGADFVPEANEEEDEEEANNELNDEQAPSTLQQ